MRSAASIRGHPIHPALIPFPVAFLIGAFVANLAGVATATPALWTTGWYLSLAGIITALAAAVPGLIDYFFTVPPKSSAKTRATLHMLAMLSAVALFALALIIRGGIQQPPQTLQLLLEGTALVFLSSGAWMGGTLAFRNQIGVDHRYANAGKWSELRVQDEKGSPVMVAREGELRVNQMKLVRVGNKRVVLARTEDGYAAFDDRCTHRGGSLADGTLACGTVQCPWHGSQFDAHTGKATAGPATRRIAIYGVTVHEGNIWLDPEKAAVDVRVLPEREIARKVERVAKAGAEKPESEKVEQHDWEKRVF